MKKYIIIILTLITSVVYSQTTRVRFNEVNSLPSNKVVGDLLVYNDTLRTWTGTVWLNLFEIIGDTVYANGLLYRDVDTIKILIDTVPNDVVINGRLEVDKVTLDTIFFGNSSNWMRKTAGLNTIGIRVYDSDTGYISKSAFSTRPQLQNFVINHQSVAKGGIMSVFTNDTSYRVAADTMTGLSRAAIVKLINTGIGSSALTDGNGTTANGTSIDLGDVNIDNGWHWTYNYGGGSYLDWYFNTTSPRFYMSSYKVSNGALAEYTHIADGIYLNQQEGDIMIQAELNNNYFGASIDSVGRNTDLRVNLDRIDINSNHPNFTGLKYLVEPTYENGTLISKSYADANYGNVANGIFEVSSGENSYYDQDTSLFTLGGEPSFYIPSLYYKAWKKDLSKFSQYTFNANGFDFDLYGYGLDNNLRVQADTNDFLIFTSYPVSTNLFQVTHDSVILHQLSGNTGKLLALSSTGGVYSYHLAHAAAYREAITYTPAVTQNVYTKITPTFTISEADSITIAGDTITIKTGYDGDYKLDFSLTMSGANGDDFRVKLYKNNATTGVNGSNHVTTTGATNYVSLSYFWYLTDLVAGDDLSFRITNTTDSDDPTITDIKFYIEKKPE